MIAFVLAMRDEAQPLIDYLRLQPCATPSLFPVFHGDEAWLTISGVGKANAASAVTELYHITRQMRDGIWLNVGIAGHADLPLGTLRSVHCIVDNASAQRWYPPQVLLKDIASSALASVDQPETTYPDDCLYDMEGAGFYPAALRCSTAEAVQCLKIVSDNRTHGTEQLTPEAIGDLVASNTAAIVEIATQLRESTHCLRVDNSNGAVAELLDRYRFSVTQRQQLIRLAQRLAARAPKQTLVDDELLCANTGRDVIRLLERRVDALPVFPSAE